MCLVLALGVCAQVYDLCRVLVILRNPSVAGPDYKESCARNRLYRRDLMVGAQLHTCADVHNWTHVQMCTIAHMCRCAQLRTVAHVWGKTCAVSIRYKGANQITIGPQQSSMRSPLTTKMSKKTFLIFQATQPGGFCIFVRVRIIFCFWFHHQPIEKIFSNFDLG